MKPTRWRKRNQFYLHREFAIAGIFLALPIALWQSAGIEKSAVNGVLLVAMTLFIAAITFAISQRHAKALIGRLTLDFDSADFALRRVLEQKNIRYRRSDKDDEIKYDLIGSGLAMTLIPHDTQYGLSPWRPLSACADGTLVTLSELNGKTRRIASILTDSIDEMMLRK